MSDAPANARESAVVRASDLTLSELVQLHTAGFEGYAVPVQMDAAALSDRIRSEHIDLASSFALQHRGRHAALTLIARRGRRSRVASMGVPPDARRQGWGRRAIEVAIDEARGRGDSLQLEVLTQNTSAVELYRGAGFRIARTLVGFEGGLDELRGVTGASASEIPVEAAAAQVGAHAMDLPWQLDAASLYGLGTGWRAWTNGPSVAVTRRRGDALMLLSVLTVPTERRRGHARRLLAAIAQAEADASRAQIISIVPEDLADHFMAACGLQRAALTQYEMRYAD